MAKTAKIKIYKTKLVTVNYKTKTGVKTKQYKYKDYNKVHQKPLDRIILPSGKMSKRATKIFDKITDINEREYIKAYSRKMLYEMGKGERTKRAFTLDTLRTIYSADRIQIMFSNLNIDANDLIADIKMQDPSIDIDDTWLFDQSHWNFKDGADTLVLPNGHKVKFDFNYYEGSTWSMQ